MAMTTYYQIHSTRVSQYAYFTIKHQAVDFDVSLSQWSAIIFQFVAGRPELAQEIFRTYLATNGHADTLPELPAVGRAGLP